LFCIEVVTEIKVPHTGSFFNSPPVGTSARFGFEVCGAPNTLPRTFITTPITDRSTVMISTITSSSAIQRNSIECRAQRLRLLLRCLLLLARLGESRVDDRAQRSDHFLRGRSV